MAVAVGIGRLLNKLCLVSSKFVTVFSSLLLTVVPDPGRSTQKNIDLILGRRNTEETTQSSRLYYVKGGKAVDFTI